MEKHTYTYKGTNIEKKHTLKRTYIQSNIYMKGAYYIEKNIYKEEIYTRKGHTYEKTYYTIDSTHNRGYTQ